MCEQTIRIGETSIHIRGEKQREHLLGVGGVEQFCVCKKRKRSRKQTPVVETPVVEDISVEGDDDGSL